MIDSECIFKSTLNYIKLKLDLNYIIAGYLMKMQLKHLLKFKKHKIHLNHNFCNHLVWSTFGSEYILKFTMDFPTIMTRYHHENTISSFFIEFKLLILV